MKPQQLYMKAFGAFAEACRIDFEPFDKSGIYLITGETGAGKTTIFDAICYALYGTASGDVRDPKQFRSQYAEPKQVTCVELRFSCGNQQYLVKRTPPYLRAALRGSGMVEQKAEAELWEIFPDEGPDNAAKHIVCSGSQAVTDKIEELTGMDGKQFRQIVMIAQGEFRKFLLSSSVEKGKILRQLFHTQNCDRIQQILKEQLDKQRTQTKERETQMLTLLHQVTPVEPKQKEIYEARLQFSGVAAAEELCDMLKTTAGTLSEQAAALAKQMQLQQKAVESLLQEIEQGKQHNAVLEQLRQAAQEQLKSVMQLEICEAAAKKADADAEKVPVLQEQVTLLQYSLPQYETVAVLQTEESALLQKQKAQEQACAEAKMRWEQTSTSCQQLSKALENHTDFALDCANLEHSIEKDTQQMQHIQELQKLLGEQQKAQKELQHCKQLAQQEEMRYFTEEKPAYDQTERCFFRSMAGNLAQQLEEKKPCPVCGALEHPDPAQQTADHVTETQFQKAKEKQQEALQQLENCRKSLAQQEEHCRMLMQQLQQQLAVCGMKKELLPEEVQQLSLALQTAIPQNRRLLAERKAQLQAEQQKKKQLEQQQAVLPQLQAAYEGIHEQLEQLKQELAVKSAERRQCQEGLPYASLALAQKQLEQLQNTIRQLEQTQQHAAQKWQQQKEHVSSLQKLAQHLQETAGDKPSYDVQAAEQMLLKKRGEKNQTERQCQQFSQVAQQCMHIVGAVQKLYHSWESEAKCEKDMETLYKMLTGMLKKGERISFERYVQTYYFNRVLLFANQKLYQLSNGRYQFLRRQEETAHNISAGLNLDVLDQYTGKSRSVETLSGGETFLASLALALGLSDTVQQQSGGIRLNAMFIDEGFGSLDSTALDNAVQVLQQLSDHQRTIGIISHVSELAERFDAQLQVQKSETGSHIVCHYE